MKKWKKRFFLGLAAAMGISAAWCAFLAFIAYITLD
jgi:Skp family chaperone for outer membrane proteins